MFGLGYLDIYSENQNVFPQQDFYRNVYAYPARYFAKTGSGVIMNRTYI